MSVWEFQAATAGWIKANVPEPEGALSTAEEDRIWASMVEDGLVH